MSLHYFQLLYYLVHAQKKFTQVLAKLHFYGIAIEGKAASLLETTGKVVLNESRPSLAR